MALIKDLIDKMKGKEEEPQNNIEDDGTTNDKVLQSLRRENRLQGESEEKQQLKEKISNFKKDFTRKHMFGIDDNASKVDVLRKNIKNRQKQILKEKLMIKDSKPLLKEKNSMVGGNSILKQKNTFKSNNMLKGNNNILKVKNTFRNKKNGNRRGNSILSSKSNIL